MASPCTNFPLHISSSKRTHHFIKAPLQHRPHDGSIKKQQKQQNYHHQHHHHFNYNGVDNQQLQQSGLHFRKPSLHELLFVQIVMNSADLVEKFRSASDMSCAFWWRYVYFAVFMVIHVKNTVKHMFRYQIVRHFTCIGALLRHIVLPIHDLVDHNVVTNITLERGLVPCTL